MYDHEYSKILSTKLGLNEPNLEIVNLWLNFLEQNKLDFTLSFYRLTHEPKYFDQFPDFKIINSQRTQLIYDQDESNKLMKAINPYLIPRNHQIEKVIQQGLSGEYSLFKEMNEALKNPWQPNDQFGLPPLPDEEIKNTFCGT